MVWGSNIKIIQPVWQLKWLKQLLSSEKSPFFTAAGGSHDPVECIVAWHKSWFFLESGSVRDEYLDDTVGAKP